MTKMSRNRFVRLLGICWVSLFFFSCGGDDPEEPTLPEPEVPVIVAPEVVTAGSEDVVAKVESPQRGIAYAWSITGGTLVSEAVGTEVRFAVGDGPAVELQVEAKDAKGRTRVATHHIVVVPVPDATIAAPAALTRGDRAEATVPFQPGMAVTWNVSGGTIETAADERVVFVPGDVDELVLAVRVESPAGTADEDQVLVPVSSAPIATIATTSGPVATGVAGLRASVPEQPGCTFDWVVTNGTIEAGQGTHEVIVTAGAPGTMEIEVVVTNPAGASARGERAIAVQAEPEANFHVQATALPGEIVVASVPMQVGATYAWTVSGGTIVSGQGTHELALEAGPPGPMQIELSVTSAAGPVATRSKTVEIYPPADATDTWTAVSGAHSAIVTSLVALPDGRAILSGGWSGAGITVATRLYTPGEGGALGAFAPMLDLPTPMAGHTTFALPNGMVLFIGGERLVSGFYGPSITGVMNAYVYDPARGVYFSSMPRKNELYGSAVAILADGRILVAGGWISNPPYYTGYGAVANVDIFEF